MPGACVRRARLQAADGAPMPTKHTSELLSARAATMVIISFGVQVEAATIWADMGEPSAFVLLFVSLGEHAHAAHLGVLAPRGHLHARHLAHPGDACAQVRRD